MTTEELLLGLKDIQPPVSTAWWQLAPGWWALVVVLLSVVGLFLFLRRRRKNRRLTDLARRELEALIKQHIDSTESRELLLALAIWLKRVALLAYPQACLEALNGEAWLRFLDRCLGDDSFSHGPGKIFGEAVYCEKPAYDSAEIVQLCRNWMLAISPVLHRRGKT